MQQDAQMGQRPGDLKHLGGIGCGYLGEVFGRTIPEPIPGDDDLENNGDLWARPDESRDFVISWYRRADDNQTTFTTPDEWKSYVAKVQAAADHFA
jgi:hypothetical protein